MLAKKDSPAPSVDEGVNPDHLNLDSLDVTKPQLHVVSQMLDKMPAPISSTLDKLSRW